MAKMRSVKICVLAILIFTPRYAQGWWDDWEVETFTRYRIDNFDQNNNGYVDLDNESALLGGVERLSIADAVEHKSDTLSIAFFENGYRAVADLFESSASSIPHVSKNSGTIAATSGISDASRQYASGSNVGVPYALDSGNASFDGVQPSSFVRTYSQYCGIMLERGIRIHKQASAPEGRWRRDSWSLSYGARFADQMDSLSFSGGGLLSSYYWLNRYRSERVGPYLGAQWSTENEHWRIAAEGSLQYAFDTAKSYHDIAQPEGTSRYVFGSSDHSETLLGELQLRFTLPLSERMDISLGYSGYVLGQIVDAAGVQSFSPPDHIDQDPAVNVAAGVAFAALEVRR